jgi:outer membrane protein TolC
MFSSFLRVAAMAGALLSPLAVAAPMTLAQALDLAVQRSAAARAARADMASAAQAAHAAGQLPDPTLSVGIDNLPVTGADRFSTTAESMTMKRLGVSQEWVSHEKRALRQAAADALTERQLVAARAAAAETRLQAALAYVDAYYAGEMLEFATVSEHHAHEALEMARARLRTSGGSAQEALALVGARGVAEDDVAELRQTQADAALVLERWIGVAVDELDAPRATSVPSEQAYVANDPGVREAQRDVDMATRDAAVAASDRQPNWSWQVAYQQRTGYSDMVSVGVSIPLAVAPAERQDRQTAARRALVEKAEARLEEATRAATTEYRSRANDVQRLATRIEGVRASVVEPARQRTEAALAGYRSGQASLAVLFEARHMEVEARRRLLMLERDQARAQVQLAFKPLAEGDRP